MTLRKYALWDKKSTIYTPAKGADGKGQFTPAEWIAMWPIASHPAAKVVCSAGLINGGYFGELSQMKQMYEQQGCVFTDGMSDTQILEAIEAWEDREPDPLADPEQVKAAAAALEALNSMPDEGIPTPEERTAAAMELMALNSMEG